jgi:ribosome-associated protein
LHGIASFTDYFIIASGTSDRMLNSLADAVLEAAGEKRSGAGKVEGKPAGGWILIDLGDIIIHLFHPEQRTYYTLEELWETGKVLLRIK